MREAGSGGFDARRRRYVPLDVHFALGRTRTALLKKFGTDGLLTWVCLIAAAKRAQNQGTFTYVTEDAGWTELGLGYPFTPNFTLKEFFTYTGHLKKTRKTASGQLKHIEITSWEDWNDAFNRQSEAERKSRKRAQNTPDIAPTTPGHYTDDAPTEYEYEGEAEPEGFTYTPIVQAWVDHAPPLTRHRHTVLISKPVKNAVEKAIRLYPEEDIVAAIGNYAAVYASEAHYFSHRWSLKDFLGRGVDKFVPEAEPLTNFVKRDSPRRDRGMTFNEILGVNEGGVDEPRALPVRSVA